ncbi:simple sugar transport system ATP-binding protein [Arcanobacterium wilhelmae]|uniref:Simple sugar transport system ATP-binding protein n=1 Tax=Arcanobacterium wilhelmae TaxID=1803177 RepID=A0ABT9NCU4_9ACTO|nr:ABC transporter ATP-binding protein [Arcanobacterium wilhelmae]MDP9801467.1 simple sugar transport system ATP-binding protein [Arcanobacterium wilhelmae]WFN90798.1 ABC transporter ATP-binding protein [Arcanobacterium wilhelmae]
MKLELRGITKRFGSLVANDSIDLEIGEGRIHALLGENGAGKSTLMNVLYGLYEPDGGEILIDGQPVTFNGPGDAVAAGIGMVHQHFMLVPVFTVAESIALGYEPTKRAGIIDRKAAAQKVKDVSARFGFNLNPDSMIEDLPVGAQQRVEIVKALSRDAKVLILDEPTAVLTPQETDELMAIMRQLADAGTSIVFITHKLREVRAVADDITVIRRGKVVGKADPKSSEADLATMMVGRPVMMKVEKEPAKPGPEALKFEDVTYIDSVGTHVLDHVSFDLHRGEVLAIAGVQGNGQTELAEAILGLVNPDAGKITLEGKELQGRHPKEILEAGVGFVPEDRMKDGMIVSFSIAENLVLDQYRDAPFGSGLSIKPNVILKNAEEKRDEYDIRLTSITDPISTLSGGNQQKVVVAREMSRDLDLLVVNQPTRGVDVGSIEFIHQRVVQVRDSGVPVLLISSELDEIEALADRIAVMYRGKIIGIVPAGTSRDALGLMMAGVPQEEALAQVKGGNI